MSAYGIVVEDGCYGIRKGLKFHPLSNCIIRLRTGVLAGEMSGYLAEAVHKDGNVKEFFYPKGITPTKLDAFMGFMNYGDNVDFFKRLTIQMTSLQLNALLTELESSVILPSPIPKAVTVVGSNSTMEGGHVWAMNRDVFIDDNGQMTRPQDHNLRWISHLVTKDSTCALASEERSASVHLPLTTQFFDLMCHFLKGTIKQAIEDTNLSDTWNIILEEIGIDQEANGVMLGVERPNVNFLPTFFTISMSIIIAHYDKWQKLAGSCPLAAAVGDPDSGKSTACKVALAVTGGWRQNFFASVSEKVSGRIASTTTMGYVIDDPTNPKDVGEALKQFFNEGTNINCSGQWSPLCSPLFSANHHVVNWLSKAERERLLSRILLIPFTQNSTKGITDEQASTWHSLFHSILEKVSSVVGNIIGMGKWLLSSQGKDSFNECLGIVTAGFGEETKGSRFSKMWACALMSARKMQELTSAVDDEDIIDFFNTTIVPNVLKFQKPILFGRRPASIANPKTPLRGKDDFMERLGEKLESVLDGNVPHEATQFVVSDVTSKQSGVKENIAIRAEILEERCGDKGITPLKAGELRESIHAYGLGTKKTQQRFHSPRSGKRKMKSCVFVKRSLFKSSTLEKIDRATGTVQMESAVGTQSAEKKSDELEEEPMGIKNDDKEHLQKENEDLKQQIDVMNKEFSAEIERLKQENTILHERAKTEMEMKEKLQKEYSAEIERLEKVNTNLHERAKTEMEMKEKLQKDLKEIKEQQCSKRNCSMDIVKVGHEMLKVVVEEVELPTGGKRKSKKLKGTCPLCQEVEKYQEWQQCTQPQCGQWVHCRCEAERDKSYQCPDCRKQL